MATTNLCHVAFRLAHGLFLFTQLLVLVSVVVGFNHPSDFGVDDFCAKNINMGILQFAVVVPFSSLRLIEAEGILLILYLLVTGFQEHVMFFGIFAWHDNFEGRFHRHCLLNSHNYVHQLLCILCLFRRSNINFVLHKDALLGHVLRLTTVVSIALPPIGRIERQVDSPRC